MYKRQLLCDELLAEKMGKQGKRKVLKTINLKSIALLRAQAAQCGFEDISQKGLVLTFTMKDFDLKRIAALSGAARFKGRILFSPGEKSALSLRLKPGEDVLAMGRKLVEAYQQLMAQ